MKKELISNISPEMVKSGKRVTHPLIAILIVFASLAASIPVMLLMKPLGSYLIKTADTAFTEGIGEAFCLICLFLPSSLFIFAWVKFFEKRKITTLGFQCEGWSKKFLT